MMMRSITQRLANAVKVQMRTAAPLARFSTDNSKPSDDHDAKDHARLQSSGSQIEGEWYRPVKGVDYSPDDREGMDVPGVFRDHRHMYSTKPEDIDAYRRQITYRVGHIGTKELEVIFRDYMTLYSAKMTYAELEQFDMEILDMENPSLQRYLVN